MLHLVSNAGHKTMRQTLADCFAATRITCLAFPPSLQTQCKSGFSSLQQPSAVFLSPKHCCIYLPTTSQLCHSDGPTPLFPSTRAFSTRHPVFAFQAARYSHHGLPPDPLLGPLPCQIVCFDPYLGFYCSCHAHVLWAPSYKQTVALSLAVHHLLSLPSHVAWWLPVSHLPIVISRSGETCGDS